MKIKVMVMVMGFAAMMTACDGGGLVPDLSVGKPPPGKAMTTALAEVKDVDGLAAALMAHALQKMESDFDEMKDQCQWPYVMATADGTGGGVDLSATNTQEADVDEADSVKAGNGIVYALDQAKLHIVKVESSKKMTTLSELAIEGQTDSLYIDGTTAIVFSRINSKTAIGAMSKIVGGYYYSDVTQVTVVDVTDPAHPKVVRESRYIGHLASSRRIGHFVHVVLNTAVNGPDLKYPDHQKQVECDNKGKPKGDMSVWNKEVEDTKIANRATITAYDFKAQLPKMPENTVIRYFDSPATSHAQLLSVVTMDASKLQSSDRMSVVAAAGNMVYASSQSLFVADRTWPDDKTVIHRFNLADGNAYSGTTEVEGHLLNQFALSEYKGVLRVATTTGQVSRDGNAQVESRITTINTQDAVLPKIGELSGIAKGEQIYAVRFVGERAFVVTFKKIDPLFVISLRDPRNPKIMGELKVPGFSTYLHPLDDGHVIGLGMNAQDDGAFAWFQGVKLSLFNVADSTSPTETQATIIGGRGTNSPALNDHHAFTYDATQKLLALPVSVYSENPKAGGSYGEFQYNGLQVYHVDSDKGFELLGTAKLPAPAKQPTYYDNVNVIKRSLFVNDGQGQSLLTVQSTGLTLHQLDAQLTPTAVVTW